MPENPAITAARAAFNRASTMTSPESWRVDDDRIPALIVGLGHIVDAIAHIDREIRKRDATAHLLRQHPNAAPDDDEPVTLDDAVTQAIVKGQAVAEQLDRGRDRVYDEVISEWEWAVGVLERHTWQVKQASAALARQTHGTPGSIHNEREDPQP